MTHPQVSVIICTYNRSAILVGCLDSLVRQIAPKRQFEVIIANNNSSDSTSQIAKTYCTLHSNFRVIDEKRAGLSHARNAGWQSANGNYIAYIDDDARADPKWVENIINFTHRHPNCLAFGGGYEAKYESKPPAWFPPEYGTHKLGETEHPIKINNEWISGTNMIFKRKVLKIVGGFNPNFGMKKRRLNYGEETDLFLRLHNLGTPIFYSPQICVRHLVLKNKMHLRFLLLSAFRNAQNDPALTYKVKPFIVNLTLATKSFLFMLKELAFSTIWPLRLRFYRSTKPLASNLGILLSCFGTKTNRQ